MSYDIAQICKNGHIINAYFNTSPDHCEKYCSICSAETITSCSDCGSSIKGKPLEYGYAYTYEVPYYCINCGSPYPWTKAILESTKELLLLENILSNEEVSYFDDNMVSIIVDTPQTKVVATKLKIFMSKASNVVANSLKDMIVDIGSDAAKKIILGQ